MGRAGRGRLRGEEWRPHRSWASVLTTPRGAHRTPGQSARGPPRHGRPARRSRCRRGRAAPTRWASDPAHSTARPESTSHNPPAQKPIPPGCAPRPSVPRKGEVAPQPKAGQSELEASTPATAAWSWKGQRYSSLGTPRQRRDRQRDLRKPGLDDDELDGDRPTHRGPGPRQHLGQVGSSLRANQTALPKAPHSRSAASGDATSRCPIDGQPRRYLGLMAWIRKNRIEPPGSCDVAGASHGR